MDYEALSSYISVWQRKPLEWVKAFFGDRLKEEGAPLWRAACGHAPDTETGLTRQQEDAFRKVGELCAAKLDSAAGIELSEARKELASKIGISIQSGQGTGKDFFSALLMCWFMTCFFMCKNLATANTGKQLRNVYWAEIAKVMRLALPADPMNPQSETLLEGLFVWQSERFFMKVYKGKEWFAEAVTVNVNSSAEEQGEALAGRHEKYMLFVLDEAAGIPDPVFKPLEGTLTGVVNIAALIFNPTRSKGFAIDSQKSGSRFIRLRWNSEDSEIVSKTHIAGMEKKYGRDSNTFRIRVLGLPPLADSDALIPWDWIENAKERPIEPSDFDPVIIGVDVGAGGDKSVACVRHGKKVIKMLRNSTKDTMQLVGWIILLMEEYNASVVGVDAIGIGHGVVNRLQEQGHTVRAIDVRKKPKKEEKFKKLRDEIWWNLREQFEADNISIPDDQDLIDQLGAVKFHAESDGTIKVDSKKEMKKYMDGSPDEADATCIAFAIDDRQYRKGKNGKNGKKAKLKGVYLR